MRHVLHVMCFALLLAATPAFAAKMALFDNAHAEQAGNADWVVDDTQPIPSPAQSGITPGTAETYWNGALSSWGVALVKRGYTVQTNTAALTYGNANNTYDLSKYDVLVICEPNTSFTAAENTAILSFVQNGGGLIAISDHSGSDRNNDGVDSPMIWNALDPTHLLGVHFGVSGDANNNIVQTSSNVATASTDSIIRGPAGTMGSLAFHNGTTLTLYPSVNANVRGEVWMTGLAQTSTTGVMCASSVYGNGRVVFEGDSSPPDDGTGASGNSLYDGWGEATDSTLFLNATLWATRRTASGDTQPPVASVTSPVGGEDWKVASPHAITWTATDNVGVTTVDLAYSTDGGSTYPNAIATGLTNSGSYTWTVPNAPSATVRVRATAHDAAGNAGSGASAANFTIDNWTITASAGTGGTITPSGAVGVAQGGSQTFTIAANANYVISSVTVDGTSVGAVGAYTFSNVTASHTISASFAATPTYTITASAGTGGTITPSGAIGVVSGGSQTFTIGANSGYVISSVTVDGTSVGAVGTYTFSNVTANHTIAAAFSASGGSYTITASAGSGGAISPSGANSEAAGSTPTFTITPNSGYHVAGVTVDGTAVGALTTYTFLPVAANHTIAATFSNSATAPYPMAAGNYSEAFGDVANWTNNFAAGIGANRFASVPVEGSGTIPDGIHTTTSTATFTTGTSGGVQKGTGNLVLLSTGTSDNTTAVAVDLMLDFTAVNAGTLGFDWATVFNSTGDRKGSLRVYTSTNGTTFTELTAADVLDITNNVAGSGTIGSVALPSSFTGSATARVRFYYDNGTGGTTGSRPKISIDNLVVTGALQPRPAAAREAGPEAPAVPMPLALSVPAPNPSRDGSRLSFTLPRAGAVRLEVLDLAGRRVWSTEGAFAPGVHGVRWDGRGADGSAAKAGVYFVRLVTGSGVRTVRMVRL